MAKCNQWTPVCFKGLSEMDLLVVACWQGDWNTECNVANRRPRLVQLLTTLHRTVQSDSHCHRSGPLLGPQLQNHWRCTLITLNSLALLLMLLLTAVHNC